MCAQGFVNPQQRDATGTPVHLVQARSRAARGWTEANASAGPHKRLADAVDLFVAALSRIHEDFSPGAIGFRSTAKPPPESIPDALPPERIAWSMRLRPPYPEAVDNLKIPAQSDEHNEPLAN